MEGPCLRAHASRFLFLFVRFGPGIGWRVGGSLGFLDHERPSWVDLPRCAEMLDVIKSAWGELVQADTVLVVVDDAAEGSDQAGLVGIAADHFED